MTRELKIVRPEDVQERIPPERLIPRWVGPPADARRVSAALGTEDLVVNVLFFEPGARSRPHSHSHDQVLYYAGGTGVVAVDGGEDQLVQTGEFVLLPGGVPHMHGASDGEAACHLSLMSVVDTDFDCPIPPQWEKWRQ